MLRVKNIDATRGPILKLVLLYTIPLIISAIVQKLFHTVDIVVLGNMADSTAVASVGATSSIIALIVDAFFGFSSGVKVLMARYIGARDTEQARNTSNTSLLTALGLGVLIAVIGCVFAPSFLRVTNCPTECYDGALTYIRIYVCSAPAILLYNFGSSILTASGDTQRPLYYVVIGGVVNAVLNVILCLILPQKVAAVAIATVASQILGALLVCHRLFTMEGEYKMELSKLNWNARTFGGLLKFGAPLSLHTALYPLANLQIQSAVNSFGVSAASGYAAASTIEGFTAAINSSFAATTTTFMSQNIGAQKHDRINKSLIYCLFLSCSVTLAVSMCLYWPGRFWIGLIIKDDAAAVDYAMIRMFHLMQFYTVASAGSVFGHAIQAYGHPLYSTLNSIVSVFGFRMIFMFFIYPHIMTFDSLMACFLTSWCMILIVNMIGYFIYRKRYEQKVVFQKIERPIHP